MFTTTIKVTKKSSNWSRNPNLLPALSRRARVWNVDKNKRSIKAGDRCDSYNAKSGRSFPGWYLVVEPEFEALTRTKETEKEVIVVTATAPKMRVFLELVLGCRARVWSVDRKKRSRRLFSQLRHKKLSFSWAGRGWDGRHDLYGYRQQRASTDTAQISFLSLWPSSKLPTPHTQRSLLCTKLHYFHLPAFLTSFRPVFKALWCSSVQSTERSVKVFSALSQDQNRGLEKMSTCHQWLTVYHAER